MPHKFNENTDFFDRLLKSTDLKEQKRIFDSLLGETTIWWLLEKKAVRKSVIAAAFKEKEGLCSNLVEARKRDKCLDCLLRNSKKMFSLGYPVEFICPPGLCGLVIPIIYNGDARIVLCICHLKGKISKILIENIASEINIIIDKIRKEWELSKLQETIRPRAIALSTVHTVHRLISSTLNLEELLPRIARLSTQVLRAKRCIIMLVDPIKKIVIPRTVIDVNMKNHFNLKGLHLKSSIENEVVNTAKIHLNNKRMCIPLIDQEVIGTITVEEKQDRSPFTNFDQEILTVLGEQAVIAIKNAQLYEERGRMVLGSIKSLAAILDTRLPDTYTHPIGFIEIVMEIGKELKLSGEDMEALKYAALLLDAGKIGIPDEILMKPAKLTGKEYRIIQEHPIKGAEIVGSIEAMKPALPVIMHHHEKYDGSGYPSGLKKSQIPMGARIIALADAFEAMICKRPYKGSMKINEAVGEIRKSSGTQFDPIVVNAFLNLVKKGRIKNIICRLQKR
jgi:HD-GYP domain-containing protein (c-di-GMP phosphodiesterase class II)